MIHSHENDNNVNFEDDSVARFQMIIFNFYFFELYPSILSNVTKQKGVNKTTENRPKILLPSRVFFGW